MVFPRQGLEMGKCHIVDADFDNDDMSGAVPSFGGSALSQPESEPVAAAADPVPVASPVAAAAPTPAPAPGPVKPSVVVNNKK
jgi:hypothetical protein